MKTFLRNLLLALPMISFMGCEDLELDISKDQSVDFQFVASEVDSDGFFFTTETINFGSDEFEDFDINSANINQLSYTISDVDNSTSFSTFLVVGRGFSSSVEGTQSPIRNVSDPIIFWTKENGFQSNEFFFATSGFDSFISDLEAAIQSKSNFDLGVIASASGELEDVTITLNIDVTANTVQ